MTLSVAATDKRREQKGGRGCPGRACSHRCYPQLPRRALPPTGQASDTLYSTRTAPMERFRAFRLPELAPLFEGSGAIALALDRPTIHNADDEARLEILRPLARQARPEPPVARLLSGLRVAGLQGARPLPGAQGPRPGGPVSPLLPRPCAGIQQVLQLLPGHARRGGGQAPEGRHHRSSADLVARRQFLGAQSHRATARGPAASPTASPLKTRSACSPGAASAGARRRSRADRSKRLERKCLRQLNLEDSATKADIKARFKELVKRLHPDHNKGDRLRGQVARSDPSL